jgi:two-component system sensor histidine kinase KdpD
MVDVTPEALINRLKRGVVYAPDKAEKALENFFREQSLAGLRELALRQAAHEVELRHETPRSSDRLLIHVTGEPTTAMLIRRARRVADYLRAECFAVYVSDTGDLRSLPILDREAVGRHLNFARNLHIETRILQGQHAASVLMDFARRERITQIFVMRPASRRRNILRTRSLVSEILRLAPDMQITVVADRSTRPTL